VFNSRNTTYNCNSKDCSQNQLIRYRWWKLKKNKNKIKFPKYVWKLNLPWIELFFFFLPMISNIIIIYIDVLCDTYKHCLIEQIFYKFSNNKQHKKKTKILNMIIINENKRHSYKKKLHCYPSWSFVVRSLTYVGRSHWSNVIIYLKVITISK
jgi:hypothetical protein